MTTVIADLLKQFSSNNGNGSRPICEVVHGTTLVTNTLIERKGARTGLIVTKGTRDVLDIGREWRYDLYDLNLQLPQPLAPLEKRREVDERLDASGDVVSPAHGRRARAPDGGSRKSRRRGRRRLPASLVRER